MPLFGSFYSGLSGLSSNATAMNVVGNNLANLNTIGFKGASMNFKDILAVNLSGSGVNGAGNALQVGLGTMPGAIDSVFAQGSVQTSNENTNMAIQGNGFFVLRNGEDLEYSRAGNFSFDSDGYLVNPLGANLLGWADIDADYNVNTSGDLSAIKIDQGTIDPPDATELFRFVANLDADAEVGETFRATIQIYDSLGETHTMGVTFTNTGPGAWNYALDVDDAAVTITGGAAAPNDGTGTIVFDSDGNLDTVDGSPAADVSFTISGWSNGASDSTLTWDLVDPDLGTVETKNLTGYSTPSATSTSYQDGWTVGRIRSVLIDTEGVISGLFSNGKSRPLAQVALATFNNPKGLVSVGENQYAQTDGSGVATIGSAGSGGRGTIIGSALELSNVDIAEEFTKMITYQRGYQANSRIITTTDSLIQEAINIKR